MCINGYLCSTTSAFNQYDIFGEIESKFKLSALPNSMKRKKKKNCKEILEKKKKNSVYIILVSIRNMNNNKKKVIFHLPIYVL